MIYRCHTSNFILKVTCGLRGYFYQWLNLIRVGEVVGGDVDYVY